MTLKQIEPSDVLGDNYYIYDLTASNYTPSLNGTISISCTLKNVFGNAVSGASLTLYKNGSSVSSTTTNSSGVATWSNISCTDAGMQKFSIKDRSILVFVDNKISKSNTSGLIKNDGTIDTSTYLTQLKIGTTSGLPVKTGTNGVLTTGSFGTSSGTFAEGNHTHTKSSITDFPTIPTKTSDLTNDGDGTNVFVKNNDSRLSDSRTPTSHTHGNLTNDGKVGSTANYFVYTTTSGAITSKQKIGNITTSGAIGSTSGLPIITTTSGVLTTGSFGTGSGTFAEGNHTHSSYASSTHTHGNLQSNGQVGSTAQANKNVVTDSNGKITTENKPTIPTAVSDLTNDSDFTTINDVLEYISENATLTIPTTGDDAGYLVLTIQ